MNRFFMIIIVLLPFLVQIKSPIHFISLGELLLIPLMIIRTINIKGKIKIDKIFLALYLLPFANLVVVVLPSDYAIISEALETVIRALFYFYLLTIIKDSINSKEFLALYVKVASFFSLYLIAQYILALLGIAHIPVLPTGILHEMAWYQGNMEYFWYLRRLGGLFIEPSRFVLYAMPAFCIAFCENSLSLDMKNNALHTMIIGAGIICSTSGIGYLTLGVFIGFEILKGSRSIKRLFFNLVCIVGGSVALVFIQRTMVGVNLLERVLTGGSIGIRIIRGCIIWSKADLFHKMFGVGVNNAGAFVQQFGIHTVYDEANLNFVPGFTSILVTTGIVGIIVLIAFLYKLVQRCKRQAFIIEGSSFFVLSMFEADVFTYKFAFLVIVYLMVSRRLKESLVVELQTGKGLS